MIKSNNPHLAGGEKHIIHHNPHQPEAGPLLAENLFFLVHVARLR